MRTRWGTRIIPARSYGSPTMTGWRITAFATNTPPAGGPHRSCVHLELRHRPRARCEDRIRIAEAAPDCATCRCTASIRTRSGSRSSPWPSNSRLVATARPHRAPGMAVGTQTHTAPAVLHRRTSRRPRPHQPAAPGSVGSVGRATHRRPRPAPTHPSAQLNPTPPHSQPGHRPASGTGAPSDLGQTVTPLRHNRKPQRLTPQKQAGQPPYERFGRASGHAGAIQASVSHRSGVCQEF